MTTLTHLFKPLTIKGIQIRNRIMSTGHDTDRAAVSSRP
jgi:2,4-dienoyl-CoA reductase-like NADH-dependent reductase (Old Yellow Enzyme family)